MIDFNAVLLEVMLERVIPEMPGSLNAYGRYQADARRLLSEIVRHSDNQESPVASSWGGRTRLVDKYLQFMREYRPRWVFLRPGIQRSHYQPYAVSHDYHEWWALCLYWLGLDRQDEEAHDASATAFANAYEVRTTLQQWPETHWFRAFPLVERAILAKKDDDQKNKVNDATVALVALENEAKGCDDNATRQKMYGAAARLWTKLIGIADHAADNAETAYKKADEGVQPRYLTYLHELEHMSRSHRETVVSRPFVLALHAQLPWLTYLVVLLCAVLCFLLLKPQSWRWFAELIQALLRSCGLSLAPMLLALFFLGIGVIAIGFGLRGFTTLVDGLSPTPEPDAGEPTRVSDIANQPPGTRKPNVELIVFVLAVQDLGKDTSTTQQIVNNLYINMAGEIVRLGETNLENDQVTGLFKIEGDVCSFRGWGGVGWLLRHAQPNAPIQVGEESVQVSADDQIECNSPILAPLVNGRRYLIKEIENHAPQN